MAGNNVEYGIQLHGEVDPGVDQIPDKMEKTSKKAADLAKNLSLLMQIAGMLGSKIMDFSSELSEAAAVVENFGEQVEKSADKLEDLKNKKESFAKQALVFIGVFSAATAAITAFVKSAGKAEIELEKMAKTQRKTAETTRSSNNALAAMGKTMADIKADKELQKAYKELMNINKELALPRMGDVLHNLKELRFAWWELKDTAKYVLDWIGVRVLKQLEEPIRRITDKLKEVAKWLRNNLDSITMKISSAITAFIKGVMGVVDGFMKVIEMVDKLDPNIRKLGAAILFVAGLIKTGPIGQILTILTLIGGVIDDLDNYNYNTRHGLTAENPYGVDANGRRRESPIQDEYGVNMEYIPIAFPWERYLDENGNVDFVKTVEGIFERLTEAITQGMASIRESLQGFSIFEMLIGPATDTSSAIKRLVEYFSSPETIERIKTLILETLKTVAEVLRASGDFLSDIFGVVVSMLFEGNDTALDAVERAFNSSSISTGLGAAFVTRFVAKMFGVSDSTAVVASVVGGLVGMFTDLYNKAAKQLGYETEEQRAGHEGEIATEALGMIGGEVTAFTDNLTTIIGALLQAGLEALQRIDLEALGSGFQQALHALVSGPTSLLGKLIKAIFKKPDPGSAEQNEMVDTIASLFTGENGLINAAVNGITARLFGADGTTSFFTSLSTAILSYIDNPDGMRDLQEDFNQIVDVIDQIWNGTWEVVASYEGGRLVSKKQHKDNGLKSLLAPLWKDFWEGPLEDASNPASMRSGGFRDKLYNAFKGIRDYVVDLWNGYEDTSGNHVKGIKELLFDGDESAVGFMESIFQDAVRLAGKYSADIWAALFNGAPQWVKNLMTGAGGENPNGPKQKLDERGNPVYDREGNPVMEGGSKLEERGDKLFIVTESGHEMEVNREAAEKLSDIIPYIDLDDNGKVLFTGQYTGLENQFVDAFTPTPWHTLIGNYLKPDNGNLEDFFENRRLLGALDSPFDILTGIFSGKQRSILDMFIGSAGAEEFPEVNTDKVKEAFAKYSEGNKIPAEMEIENESEFKSDVAELVETDYGAVVIPIVPDGSSFADEVAKIREGGGGPVKTPTEQAYGGRIGREMNNLTVGEDGPEYIIPISKPSRARDLIKQMFGEMGTSAVQQIIGDLGIGMGAGTIGSDYASIASALGGGSSVTTNNNVSAPVTINVQASGVGAEDVGERAYDAAQRHLMRTLRGVFA